jgi:hypothetical protein
MRLRTDKPPVTVQRAATRQATANLSADRILSRSNLR